MILMLVLPMEAVPETLSRWNFLIYVAVRT
jgi:hypothetical protein